MDDKILRKPVLEDYGETRVAANSSTSYTANLQTGNVFEITLTGNCAFTFSNPPASGTAGSFTLILKQDGTGGRTVTWPAAVDWQSGSAPTVLAHANAINIYTFMTTDGGTTWYGMLSWEEDPANIPEVPNITLVDYVNAATVNSDTWTLTGRTFGALATTYSRHLILVVTCQDSGNVNAAYDAAFTFTSTIGGVSATINNQGSSADEDAYNGVSGGVAIGIASENTQTTGTIVVTLGNYNYTMNTYSMALYRAVGLTSATPGTTPTGTTNLTLVVPSNGFGVVGAIDASLAFASCGAFSGTGATGVYDGAGGAAMYRTTSGSVVHDSTNATLFRGATWTLQ